MYIFVMIVHVIVCFVLILVVLLQAGRGGGLTDMMGGQAQSIFGTQTSEFMVKATEVCAILFVVTSLSLGIMTTQRGKSLMERHRFGLPSKQVALPVPSTPKETAPVAQGIPQAAVSSGPAASVSASETKQTEPSSKG